MNLISSIGLILDMIGVLLLFKYGLPSKISEGEGLTIDESEEAETKRNKINANIKWRAYIGLALILMGFVLQLIGTNLPFLCKLSQCQ